MTAPRQPETDRPSGPPSAILVSGQGLQKRYRLPPAPFERGRRLIHALDDVSLEIVRGTTFGLVGESGSGKSTLGRCLAALETVDAGDIVMAGQRFADLGRRDMRALRRHFQMVFQDPYAALNPRKTIGRLIREPLDIHRLGSGAERAGKVADLMALVGLRPDQAERYPNELSGGQRQRVVIARALTLDPSFLILDEPTSALDVSVQAQIVNLLLDLQARLSLTYLFISHNLMLVRHMSDTVAVMHAGRIVECGPAAEVFARPQADYTRALIAQSPRLSA
jgi:peptide/nickel transport system ATP-binding protein/oligopeptide transport system ATP-binding protein